ncbi:MAG TPA: response regulator transcription factor [Burkholderiales bacterium]|nr:response regulator transcription factor [Burkholderiales bacterium]
MHPTNKNEGTALIVEDHPLFLNALLELVAESLPRLHTIAVASAEEGLKIARSLPDVRLVLLDPGLPGLSGAEAVSAFVLACPNANIAAISASEDRHQAAAILRAGAKVLISKAASPEILRTMLFRLSSGQMAEPAWITAQGHISLELGSLVLTPRQREILGHLAQGHSNKEIGLRLELAEITVKVHVSGIFKALGVANRTQAVMTAQRLRLLAS